MAEKKGQKLAEHIHDEIISDQEQTKKKMVV